MADVQAETEKTKTQPLCEQDQNKPLKVEDDLTAKDSCEKDTLATANDPTVGGASKEPNLKSSNPEVVSSQDKELESSAELKKKNLEEKEEAESEKPNDNGTSDVHDSKSKENEENNQEALASGEANLREQEHQLADQEKKTAHQEDKDEETKASESQKVPVNANDETITEKPSDLADNVVAKELENTNKTSESKDVRDTPLQESAEQKSKDEDKTSETTEPDALDTMSANVECGKESQLTQRKSESETETS